MIKKISYEDYNGLTGHFESSLEQALDIFRIMTWQDGSFLSLDINDVNVLQILFYKQMLFLVEITNDGDDMIYLQKYADSQQCEELLIYYFSSQSVSNTSGFYKVPIQAKTLDDVLKENN